MDGASHVCATQGKAEPRPGEGVGAQPFEQALLFTWFSPSFPIGGFAYSHGLEAAVSLGAVNDAASLQAWLLDLLGHGAIKNDLIILAASHKAARARIWGELAAILELSAALNPSAERRLEALTQGGCFAEAIAASWPVPLFAEARAACPGPWPLAAAAGVAVAAHGIALAPALEAFALSFISNQVFAAIRLGVIGQTAGQMLIARLLAPVREVCNLALTARLEDLGAASFLTDLCSMLHETQYSRLFRS